MAGSLIVICSSFTIGFLILQALKIRTEGLMRLILAISSGLCFWCFFLFLAGHLYLFNTGFLTAVSILPALFLPVIILRIKPRINLPMLIRNATLFEKLLAGAIFVILILSFLSSFSPVSGGIRNDEVHNHLSMPKEWLRNAGIVPLPFAISYQAGNAHLLFLLASVFSAESGPKLISWFAFVLCTAAVYSISRLYMKRETALLAATLVAVNPLIFRGAPTAFVDELSSLFVIVPVLLVSLYSRKRDISYLLLSSLLLGTGCGTKPTNVLYAFSIIVLLVLVLLKREKAAQALKTGLFLSTFTVLFASPWIVRTYLYTGSPVFPPPLFWIEKFGIHSFFVNFVPYSIGEVNAFYDYCTSRYGDYTRNLIQAVRFPWDLTMNPENFQIGDSIGTMMLSFLPFIFLAPGSVPLFIPAAAGLSSFLIYFLVLPEARYYMAAFMLISPLIAKTVEHLAEKPLLKHLVNAVLFINVLFSLLVAARITLPKIRHLTGEARENYRLAHIPYCETFNYIKNHSIDNVTIFYFHPVFYYLPCDYQIRSSLDALPDTSDTSYVLDIDFSQILDRDFSVQNRSFMLQSTPENAELAFEGPDARLYRFIRKK